MKRFLFIALAALPLAGCLSWENSGWDDRQAAINSYATSSRPYYVPGTRYWTGSSHCCAGSHGGRR
jgi:hypothetical protein